MTIWNPLKNFGGAPPNAREWPSSRATQEASYVEPLGGEMASVC
jgi:hypothetical protein